MPHAEYPSGSACLCEGFSQLMRLITGSDIVFLVEVSILVDVDFFFSRC